MIHAADQLDKEIKKMTKTLSREEKDKYFVKSISRGFSTKFSSPFKSRSQMGNSSMSIRGRSANRTRVHGLAFSPKKKAKIGDSTIWVIEEEFETEQDKINAIRDHLAAINKQKPRVQANLAKELLTVSRVFF